MDYEQDSIHPDEQINASVEHTDNNAQHSPNQGHYSDGISSQPFVDRVYEPVHNTSSTNNAAPEYTSYNVPPHKTVKPKKTHRGTIPALVLVLCMVMSVALGFGGGVLAFSYMNKDDVPAAAESTQQQTANESSDSQAQAALPQSIDRTDSNKLSVADVVDKVADSVVEISTESVVTSQYLQQYITEGAGSGVIISEDGTIITCHHVIEGAEKVIVKLRNGEQYEAQIIAADATSDVAVLKIEASGLTAAAMGDSDALSVGEDAIVIGNPLGSLGGSVTNGIISALEREIIIDNEKMVLMQTNAAINPGNSGGGMFDAYGNLIGIVVAKSSGSTVEGLGFAIPINTVKDVYEQLINNGYVTGRAALGITMMEQTAISFNSGTSRAYVVVTAVSEGSPAEAAGIQQGDIILSIDDVEMTSAADVKSTIQSHSVGDTIELVLLRGNRTVTVSATLTESVPEETQPQ
jgi:serine protease Do